MKSAKHALTAISVLLIAVGSGCGESSSSAPEKADFGRCDVTGKAGQRKLDVVSSGVLTLGAVLPRPIYYDGASIDSIDGGYEYCLAANVAQRVGLKRIQLRNVSFDALMSGRVDGYDFAAAEIFATPERAKQVDFSRSYYKSATGVMVRSDSDITKESLADATIGVFLGSVQDGWVRKVLKPDKSVRTYESTVDMFSGLQARQVDVVLVDAEIELPAAASSGGKLKVIAQLPQVSGDYALVLPKGSKNTAVVDVALKQMGQDGTLDRLVKRWLVPAFGGVDPKSLPAWKY